MKIIKCAVVFTKVSNAKTIFLGIENYATDKKCESLYKLNIRKFMSWWQFYLDTSCSCFNFIQLLCLEIIL
jgi:hypothetical protein